MRIAIAINKHDLHLAEAQSALIAKQGGVGAHNLVLFVSKEVAHLDGDICSNYKKAFGRFERVVLEISQTRENFKTHIFPHVPIANQVFQAAWRHLLKTKTSEEVYWFEPDCVPLDERWADELSRDYLNANAQRRVFLGRFLPRFDVKRTTDRETGEVHIDRIPVIGETYMMGSGIYPANLPAYSGLWDKAKVNPWDGVMQWETMRLGVNTEKILHNHATKNYAVKTPGSDKQDAALTCEVINEFGHSNPEISIPPGSLVLHGCKDTSLIDIISAGLHKKTKAPKSNSSQ